MHVDQSPALAFELVDKSPFRRGPIVPSISKILGRRAATYSFQRNIIIRRALVVSSKTT